MPRSQLLLFFSRGWLARASSWRRDRLHLLPRRSDDRHRQKRRRQEHCGSRHSRQTRGRRKAVWPTSRGICRPTNAKAAAWAPRASIPAADYIADQACELNRYGLRTDMERRPVPEIPCRHRRGIRPGQSSRARRTAQGERPPARLGLTLVVNKDAHAAGDQRQRPLRPAAFLRRIRDHRPQGRLRRLRLASTRRARRWSCSAISRATKWTTRNRPRSSRPPIRPSATSRRTPSEHGASAVFFCSDQAEMVAAGTARDDTLLSFHVAGTTFTHPDLPVVTCRCAAIDRVLQSCRTSHRWVKSKTRYRPHTQAG